MQGREDQFREVYDRHYAAVLGYALRRADSRDDAADGVAETFLITWRRLEDLPAGDDALLWLYATARRVLANQVRATGRRRRLTDQLGAQLPVHSSEPHDNTSELVSAVAAALRCLNDADRELLLLAAWEELDAAQISEVLGCSRGAARVRLHRARQRLRRALDSEEPKRTAASEHLAGRRAAARPDMEEAW
jgi:RNA polymerase sigma factor (sigma-70 family)